MSGSADGHPPRVSRWLLIVALTLGVAGMHTLGHLDSGHGSGGMSAATMHGTAMQPQLARSTDPGFSSSGEEPRGFDPTSICLAVLTGLLILFLAARRSRLGWVPPTGGPGASHTHVARPPPKRTALRLARLSILRI
jgi:hypothetical protein